MELPQKTEPNNFQKLHSLYQQAQIDLQDGHYTIQEFEVVQHQLEMMLEDLKAGKEMSIPTEVSELPLQSSFLSQEL